MQTIDSETTKNASALVFKAHDATETLKKILKECYVNATDEDDEDCYRVALDNLSCVKDCLPHPPKPQLSAEERRRKKETEYD